MREPPTRDPRAAGPSHTTPIKNEASGEEPADDLSYGRMRLPHERDEDTEDPPGERPLIEQAANDLDAGQVDTDRYNSARIVFGRRNRPDKLKP